MSDQENGEGEMAAMRAFCAVVTCDSQVPVERATGWLGREGSNLRMTESKSVALPLGYAPTVRLLQTSPKQTGRTIVSPSCRGNGAINLSLRPNPLRC